MIDYVCCLIFVGSDLFVDQVYDDGNDQILQQWEIWHYGIENGSLLNVESNPLSL
jgi:hypothetical protein